MQLFLSSSFTRVILGYLLYNTARKQIAHPAHQFIYEEAAHTPHPLLFRDQGSLFSAQKGATPAKHVGRSYTGAQAEQYRSWCRPIVVAPSSSTAPSTKEYRCKAPSLEHTPHPLAKSRTRSRLYFRHMRPLHRQTNPAEEHAPSPREGDKNTYRQPFVY